ncbi:MAG: efflux RND transporter periplasmic adaptor subunit, partial [Candidatus Binatia bacterium]
SNPAGDLKPGMFARAEIVVQRRRGVLQVPEGAQVRTPKGYGVFKVPNKGSKVKLVSVKTGISHKGWVEVEGSLQPGDRVVTLGSSLLRDGQKVAIMGDRPAGRAGNSQRKRRSKQP